MHPLDPYTPTQRHHPSLVTQSQQPAESAKHREPGTGRAEAAGASARCGWAGGPGSGRAWLPTFLYPGTGLSSTLLCSSRVTLECSGYTCSLRQSVEQNAREGQARANLRKA